MFLLHVVSCQSDQAQYSLKLNTQAQEQHQLSVLRMAKALREFAVCVDAEDELFEEFPALDASVRLHPVRVNAVGSIRDNYSLPNMFLREIQEFFPAVFKQTRGTCLKKPQRAYRLHKRNIRKGPSSGQGCNHRLRARYTVYTRIRNRLLRVRFVTFGTRRPG